jgi:TrpR family trp operon transcriptional repressor
MKEKHIDELAKVLIGIRNKGFMVRFLQEILTPAEIDTLVLRWELVKLLYKGVPQRQISQRLGISLCKITRGSREMKKEGSAIRELLQQSEETRTDEKWKEEVDD